MSVLPPSIRTQRGNSVSMARQPTIGQHFKTKLCPSLFGPHRRCPRGDMCNYAHSQAELRDPPDLKKTKLCTNYIKGKCTDQHCKWAHGRRELRSTEDFYKVTICRYWVRGDCYAGAACRHAHGLAELRAQINPIVQPSPRDYQTDTSSSYGLNGAGSEDADSSPTNSDTAYPASEDVQVSLLIAALEEYLASAPPAVDTRLLQELEQQLAADGAANNYPY